MAVDDITRNRLKGLGLWQQFLTRRDELKAGGMDHRKAQAAALAEFTPQMNLGISSSLENGDAGGSPGSDCCPVQGGPIPFTGVYEEMLERKADVVEIIAWVAKHIEVPGEFLTVESAPCLEAWGMLMHYRGPHRGDFWDKVYVKLIPSRAQLDTGGAVVADGEAIVRAIDKLMSFKGEVDEQGDAEDAPG